MKTKDLDVLFPIWHDFETDLNFFKLSDQEIFDITMHEYRMSKDFYDNLEIFGEIFCELGISGIKTQCKVSKIRRNVPELVALLYLIDDEKNGKDAEEYKALAKSLSQDILSITKVATVVHTLNSCHFFVSGVMNSVMKIHGCKKMTFRIAKNIFAARALLDSEPIRMIDIQNILECLTPLFQYLHETLYGKDPNGRNTQCIFQLVEVFEAMSKFIGIDTESDASEKLKTASVSSEA